MLIKLTIEQSYNEVVFIFDSMHEASIFIESAMEHTDRETKFIIEQIKPVGKAPVKSFKDMLAEDEE